MSAPNARTTAPQPGEGMLGLWDRAVGPGAARWEIAGAVGFAAAAALLAPVLLRRQLIGEGTPRGPLSALRRRRRALRG